MFLRKSGFVLAIILGIVLLTIAGCSLSADSDPVPNPMGPNDSSWASSIADVKKAIAENPNINWVAGETWVTKTFANAEEAKVLLGLQVETISLSTRNQRLIENSVGSTAEDLDFKESQIVGATRPGRFSWLEKDGKNWMTSVKDQGPYGTCVAFACCGALEAAVKIGAGLYDYSIDLSEWYLWHKMTDGKNPSPGGWWSSMASDYLKNNGIIEESLMPYSLARLYPAFTEPVGSPQKYSLKAWKWLIGDEQVKTALLNGPLVSGMIVYEDFFDYEEGIYRHVLGKDGVGHAIVIVGYDDIEQYWICKNSWTTDWGEEGYFKIAYGELYSDLIINNVPTKTVFGLAYTPENVVNPTLNITTLSPAENQNNVSVTTTVTVGFDKAISPTTMNTGSFKLASGTSGITGSVLLSEDGKSATFTPSSSLPYGSIITVTLTTGVKDLAGNPLASQKQWSFTTSTQQDITPPTVLSVIPAENAVNVPINSQISVNFSEAVAVSTINASTFTVANGNTLLAGSLTVSGDGKSAMFSPTNTMPYNTVISVTLSTEIKDLAGNSMTAKSWVFTTAGLVDTTQLTVTSVAPVENATNVAINSQITANFSEAINTSTITASSFTVTSGGTYISGNIAFSGTSAVFTPTNPFAYDSVITVTLSSSITDLAGNGLGTSKIWSFTTTPDTIAPTIVSVTPAENAVGVNTNSSVAVVFSEAMNQSTITEITFSLTKYLPPNIPVHIPGTVTVSADGLIATFTPSVTLPAGTGMTATVMSSVKDLAGNSMSAEKSWVFTSTGVADTTPPSVSSVTPAENAKNIAINSQITVNFSEAVNASSVNASTFSVANGGVLIAGTIAVSGDGLSAVFTPTNTLPYSTAITVTISTGVKDLAGNSLASQKQWSFTTASQFDPTAFITLWDTRNTTAGSSASNQIKLPLVANGSYNFTINWGDGNTNTITAFDQAEVTHTYAAQGEYVITITGEINGWQFSNTGDKEKILDIRQFGNLLLGNNGRYFMGCSNLTITAADPLDLTGTTSLYYAFAMCTSLTTAPSMATWDVSNVTNMGHMFDMPSSNGKFNQDISAWNVSNVTDMAYMFAGTNMFNQDISNWSVGNVTDMTHMFGQVGMFNQDISGWDVSKVTSMSNMFAQSAFNQDISGWNVSNVIHMDSMFYGTGFNQNISGWDVSNVTKMFRMFEGAGKFNQDISGWNVSNVDNMQDMLKNATGFSTANYDSLLTGWAAQPVKNNVTFGASPIKYSAAAAASRATLVGKGWIITDGGQLP